MYMYMYVQMYMHVYTCTYMYMYIYVHVHVHMYMLHIFCQVALQQHLQGLKEQKLKEESRKVHFVNLRFVCTRTCIYCTCVHTCTKSICIHTHKHSMHHNVSYDTKFSRCTIFTDKQNQAFHAEDFADQGFSNISQA